MKLYIPELKDKLILEKDWTFSLYAEHRNSGLACKLGYNLANGFIKTTHMPKYPKAEYIITYPNKMEYYNIFGKLKVDKYYEACRKAERESVSYQRYINELNEYHKLCSERVQQSILVTIPAGSELIIDRVYIRKGQAEYSSVSFYVDKMFKGCKPRFWAKLEDVNYIEYK
jgi:hypothetical protein